VFAELRNDTLRVHHTGAFYNCCAVIEFNCEHEDSIIDLIEREIFPEGPCYCLCCFDLSVDVLGLHPGHYVIRVWDETQTTLYGETELTIPGRATSVAVVEVNQSGCVNPFIRGDADGSAGVAMSDAIHILRAIYIPGATLDCMDSADADDDGDVAMSDGIYILRHLYIPDSPPPHSPFPDCGVDPTPDRLGCDVHRCGE
jgi:hypothetical protein